LQGQPPLFSDIPIKSRPLKGQTRLASLRHSMSFETTIPTNGHRI